MVSFVIKKRFIIFFYYHYYNYLCTIIIIIIIIISNIPYCLNFNPFQYGEGGGGGTLPWAAGTLEPLAYITTVSQTILC